MLKIVKIDEVNVKITCTEQSTLKEISDKFSFLSPNYQFDYRFKNNWWNGKKTFFNIFKKTFYIGLLPKLLKWLNESGYEYELDSKLNEYEFSVLEAKEFIKTLNLPFEVRDYQLKYFIKSVRHRRLLCISPTASGKSLIIYLIFKYFNKKTLLIVPQLSLLPQMLKDFKSYGYENVENNVHLIHAGTEKNSDKPITISTWQSLLNVDKGFFKQFDVILGDEAHLFKANSLKEIMQNASNVGIKIGFTGTLTGNAYDNALIEGLFGPVVKYISTKEMINKEYSPELKIKAIILNHTNFENEHFRMEYDVEIDYLIKHEKRNKFIKNLACSLKGNTFIMFRIKDHGKELYRLIKEKSKYPVYYVDGNTSVDEREKIRLNVESNINSITVASTVFTTGINITTIDNIIFAFPSKSRVRVLQSIGRGLRKNKNKINLFLFDICDKFSNLENYTLLHFKERLKLYKEEMFNYKIYRVNI
jgi:superfamily II DNA or RNA helicase